MKLLPNFPQTRREKRTDRVPSAQTPKRSLTVLRFFFLFKKKKLSVTGLRLGDRVILKNQISDFKNETLFVKCKLAKLK